MMLAALLLTTQAAHPGTPFQPWGPGSYATVNAIEFAPDGQTMFVALSPSQVAKIERRAPSPDAPEIALYESRREGDHWSRPQLMPFAGVHKDYEGTLSPDGTGRASHREPQEQPLDGAANRVRLVGADLSGGDQSRRDRRILRWDRPGRANGLRR
jgi:hypothetical protein